MKLCMKELSPVTKFTHFYRCMAIKRKIPYRLEVQGLDPNKYTHVPIPFPKTGGRGIDGMHTLSLHSFLYRMTLKKEF